MSKKLLATTKKIDAVFEKMYRKGNTPSGKRWSERTKHTYAEIVKAFARKAYKEFGIADISIIKEEQVMELIESRINTFHKGSSKEAYNIKTLIAGINAFNKGVDEFNVFKRKFTLGDTKSMREILKAENIFRKSSASTTLRATPDDCTYVINNICKMGYDTEIRDLAHQVARISFETGGRISSVLKLKAKDIDTVTNTIVFEKDKGGLTRSVRISEATSIYLEKLKAGKQNNQFLFQPKRKKEKTLKSIKEIRKEVTKIITTAGKELNVTHTIQSKDKDGNFKKISVTQKFTPHSLRKGFALKRTKEYLDTFSSKAALNKYVSQRIKKDPFLKDKLTNIRSRVNKSRISPRQLYKHEYAIFFTSVDLGHYRNDVITAYYTTFTEVMNYYSTRIGSVKD